MESAAPARRAALVTATLAGFLTPFMDSATTVALPAISQEFGMNAIQLSWIRMAYLLAAAALLVPFGKLADIWGRKRIFRIGISIFSAAALLSGLSLSGPMLIASRVLLGAGNAMVFGTGVAILTSVYPPAERGRVIGINVASVYLGLSLGPTIGGFLTGTLGWRSLYFFSVPLGLVALAYVLFRLEGEWAEARGERLDVPGSLLYGLALTGVLFGFSRLPRAQGAVLIAAGLVGLAVFGAWELRARYPVLNVRLLAGNRTFAFSNLAALIHYSATSGIAFLLSLYLQYIHGLKPDRAGLVLIAQPIVMAVLSPAAGRMSDRIDARVLASAGMACTSAGLIALCFLSEATPVWMLIVQLAFIGFGFALFSSPNTSAVMGSVEKQHYAVAYSTLSTMRLVGQALSMGIATLLFALVIGGLAITPAVYPAFLVSTKAAFAIFAVLCVGGVFASLARGKSGEPGRSTAGPGLWLRKREAQRALGETGEDENAERELTQGAPASDR
ncbi:MAG TPA: MFS transporter [Anaerolineae bacterium]|nr:MFS transporter [Anaerolineae bacterium]